MYKVFNHTFHFLSFFQLILRRLHDNSSPQLTGLPYPADRATRPGGSPHLSRKGDQGKTRDYMDRHVNRPLKMSTEMHFRLSFSEWGPFA